MPAPKRLPKPIPKARIVVSTDTLDHKKAWQETVADFVLVGDIVQGKDRGLVENVEHEDITVNLTFKNGRSERVFLDTPLTVFTTVRNGDS